MKIAHTDVETQFTPVSLELTFETQQELDTFTAIMSRIVKVPQAVFHPERGSDAVDSLQRRGISPSGMALFMRECFRAAIKLGGQP